MGEGLTERVGNVNTGAVVQEVLEDRVRAVPWGTDRGHEIARSEPLRISTRD